MPENKALKIITVTVSDALHDQIRKRAYEDRITKRALIRRAIVAYLAENESETEQVRRDK